MKRHIYNTYLIHHGSCKGFTDEYNTKQARDYAASQLQKQNVLKINKWEMKFKETAKTVYYLSVYIHNEDNRFNNQTSET